MYYQLRILENDLRYILQLLRSGDEEAVEFENWTQSSLLYEKEAMNGYKRDD
jgi:hypothetical protein